MNANLLQNVNESHGLVQVVFKSFANSIPLTP